eukprot:COSAG01_NODE_8357_length_2818_cov_1.726002_3_plen_89_part_00
MIYPVESPLYKGFLSRTAVNAQTTKASVGGGGGKTAEIKAKVSDVERVVTIDATQLASLSLTARLPTCDHPCKSPPLPPSSYTLTFAA